MNLPAYPTTPTLPHLQQYMQDLCAARGWNKSTDLEIFLLFVEEVGELAKAMRNQMALYQEPEKKDEKQELAGEFADVFSYLLDLANRFDIDLEAAFREKEAINAHRKWD